VILSTLLGSDPPRLPVATLVRATALFGISEGTVRTSLSRMVARGELRAVAGAVYELAGDLLARQERQAASRAAVRLVWNGRWRQAVVGGLNGGDARPASDRAALRAAMRSLRMGELREGVWLRPDNLDVDRAPDAIAVVDEQCRWGSWWPDGDDGELAASLWDLDGWRHTATELRREMAGLQGRLDDGDLNALAPGFVLSAAVLRHFQADPLLPDELCGRHWPGPRLRADYDRFDGGYRALLREWFRSEVASVGS
jgi:phenylacetic acid degradation operon negative regulatory protein